MNITDNHRETLQVLDSITGLPFPVKGNSATGAILLTPTSAGILVPYNYDYIGYTNTNTTTDTYVYKTGGSGGTTVATITIVFTDTTKSQISTVTRS